MLGEGRKRRKGGGRTGEKGEELQEEGSQPHRWKNMRRRPYGCSTGQDVPRLQREIEEEKEGKISGERPVWQAKRTDLNYQAESIAEILPTVDGEVAGEDGSDVGAECCGKKEG